MLNFFPLTSVALLPTIPVTVHSLSINIDHIATLRQARREPIPDPVQAATLVELGGADGVTVHLRQDRRHINDRDIELLRRTVKTELTIEMADTAESLRIARQVKPDQVTLVPEVRAEVTTTSGLDLTRVGPKLRRSVAALTQAGVRVRLFIEPDPAQCRQAAALGASVVELNTDRFSRGWLRRPALLDELCRASAAALEAGLCVHVGHGLDYRNVVPIAERRIATGYSIGFAVVARAVMVGLRDAVMEMKRTLEVYS
jgi:pyridoxine 5-phosphate synthase